MILRRALSLLTILSLAAAVAAPVVRADDGASAAASVAPAKKKKRAVKKKPYDYEQSKYKAYKELVADDTHSYRFDERGNPIVAGSKKKKAAAKKKKQDEEPASCGAGEACQDDDAGEGAKASADPGSED